MANRILTWKWDVNRKHRGPLRPSRWDFLYFCSHFHIVDAVCCFSLSDKTSVPITVNIARICCHTYCELWPYSTSYYNTLKKTRSQIMFLSQPPHCAFLWIYDSLQCLIIGGGPCGLRTAIELALLGCKVVVIEKRDTFSRNNVLHLWPYTIEDLRGLGAKKFYGKFCAGSIDHISECESVSVSFWCIIKEKLW